MKKRLLCILIGSAVLAGCSTTTVVKDISGPEVVDVMYAKFAQEVTTAMNRLADVEDMNKVNVINAHNANTQPLNESYNGTVARQNKIIVPDTYPQTQWRNDGVTTTTEDAARAVKNTAAINAPVKQAESVAQSTLVTQSTAPVRATQTVQTLPAKSSVVNDAVVRNNNRIKAAAGTSPVKFECPTGSEIVKKGRTTICTTTTVIK